MRFSRFYMSADSQFDFLEKIKLPRSENSFVGNESDVFVVVFITESSSGDYEMNVRISVKLSSECMNYA